MPPKIIHIQRDPPKLFGAPNFFDNINTHISSHFRPLENYYIHFIFSEYLLANSPTTCAPQTSHFLHLQPWTSTCDLFWPLLDIYSPSEEPFTLVIIDRVGKTLKFPLHPSLGFFCNKICSIM